MNLTPFDLAEAALFGCLAFDDHRRRRSALGSLSPAEYERRIHEQRAPRLAA